MKENRFYNGLRTVILGMLVLVSATAVFAQNRGSAPGITIDPVSIKAPDPTERFPDIEIEQKLNAPIPLDLTFTNSHGEKVKLADYFNQDKPVILSLVYFECPMICTAVLNGLMQAIDAGMLELEIGKDYEVVTISIDPDETPALALKKKANYISKMRREGVAEGWHWLVSSQDDIEDLAQSVGFRYYYDAASDQYAHAAGIMILTPDAKVSSYMFGVEYLPRNLKMALVDAGQGNIGSAVDRLVLLCFAYDPASGGYGFYILGALRLFCMALVLALLAFWGVNYQVSKRSRGSDAAVSERGSADTGTVE